MLLDDDVYLICSYASCLEDTGLFEANYATTADEMFRMTTHGEYNVFVIDISIDRGKRYTIAETADGWTTGLSVYAELKDKHPDSIVVALSNNSLPQIVEYFDREDTRLFAKRDYSPEAFPHALISFLEEIDYCEDGWGAELAYGRKSKTEIDFIEAEVDNTYQILAPNDLQMKAKTETYKDSYAVISVKLRNTSDKTIYLNRLNFMVENYSVDVMPYFDFSLSVSNRKLLIEALNKGWGEATDVKFNAKLFCNGKQKELTADNSLMLNSIPTFSSNETQTVFVLSATAFNSEHGVAVKYADDVSVQMQYSFVYMGKANNGTVDIILPSADSQTQKLIIQDGVFSSDEYHRPSKKLLTKPDTVYASVINGIGSKIYKISRKILPDEIDAFNIYIGTDKSSSIGFKLVFLHGKKMVAESELITVCIKSHTNSESYNNRIDGCEISVDKFIKTNEFN
jgi:DNA-binding NarL/FixJ family response regulator